MLISSRNYFNWGFGDFQAPNPYFILLFYSARTITRLMEQGYVYRKPDESLSRAYNLYLTEKAKKILPAIHEEIQTILGLITEDLSLKKSTLQ